MSNNDLIYRAAMVLAEPFEIDGSSQLAKDDELYERVKSALSARIADLLERDFERLMQICYQIDLNEQKVKAALFSPEGQSPSDLLAELILKRQIQKIEIWQKYSPS